MYACGGWGFQLDVHTYVRTYVLGGGGSCISCPQVDVEVVE